MKRFLKDAVFCFLLFMVLVLLTEFFATKVNNNYSYKYNYIEHHGKEISTLLMGQSQFEYSINPCELGDSVFILAQSARAIYYDYAILERYLSKMPNVRTIVFPINVGHLASECSDAVNYSKSYDIAYPGWPYCLTSRSLLLSHALNISYFKQKTIVDDKGYSCIESVWNGKFVAFPPQRQNKEAVEQYTLLLQKIASICQAKNIRFIAIACPLSNLYLSKCSGEMYDDMLYVVENVSNKYKIEFCDYTRDEEYRSDSLYCDSNHLNHRGATMFAKRVRQDFNL